MSSPVFNNTYDEPPSPPNHGSKGTQEVVKPPELGSPAQNSRLPELSLVLVEEVVIVPVKRLHRYGLPAQRTPAVLGMQDARGIQELGALLAGAGLRLANEGATLAARGSL
jgi:hypothetical protein